MKKLIFIFVLVSSTTFAQTATPCCWTMDSMPAKSSLRDSISKWINRFEKSIKAFERQDDTLKYPKDLVIFTGSSTIRLWKTLAEDFPEFNVLNRGFGGSTLQEVNYFAERIIYKHKPKAIVIYCGENDLSNDFSRVEDALYEFKILDSLRQKFLPKTKLFFISMKPSPSRAQYWPKLKMANEMIKAYIKPIPNVYYVDITTKMFTKNGMINDKLFKKDMLHMKTEGYQLWISVLKPILVKRLLQNVK